jgi:hypothetical protein
VVDTKISNLKGNSKRVQLYREKLNAYRESLLQSVVTKTDQIEASWNKTITKPVSKEIRELRERCMLALTEVRNNPELSEGEKSPALRQVAEVLNDIVKQQKELLSQRLARERITRRIQMPNEADKEISFKLLQQYPTSKKSMYPYKEYLEAKFTTFFHLMEATDHAVDYELKEWTFAVPRFRATLSKIMQRLEEDSYRNTNYGKDLRRLMRILRRSPLTEKKIVGMELNAALQLIKIGCQRQAYKIIKNADEFLAYREMTSGKILASLLDKRLPIVRQINQISKLKNVNTSIEGLNETLALLAEPLDRKKLFLGQHFFGKIMLAGSHISKLLGSFWINEPDLLGIKLLVNRIQLSMNNLRDELLLPEHKRDLTTIRTDLSHLKYGKQRLEESLHDLKTLSSLVEQYRDLYVYLVNQEKLPPQRAKRQAFFKTIHDHESDNKYSLWAKEAPQVKAFYKHFAMLYQAAFIRSGGNEEKLQGLFNASQILIQIMDSTNLKKLIVDISTLGNTQAFFKDLNEQTGIPTYRSLSADQRRNLILALAEDFNVARQKRTLLQMGRLVGMNWR